tara:strand:+ start:4108 stop:4296 length:189 start_codon:yes stop_codon:yes gene_type:complete
MSKYKFNNVPAGCVVIKLETFFRLHSDSNFLDALKATGVDNWCGYSDAVEYNEEQQAGMEDA